MKSRVRDLANGMKLAKKEDGIMPVLILGAGASLSSGVKATSQIIEELLEEHGARIDAGDQEDRFAALWEGSTEDERRRFLSQYLECRPSRGYEQLVELIQAGYIDLIVTLNFDTLLETALNDAGFTDFKTIIRGETELEAIPTLIEAREPAVKILKLHGSLRSADRFLFSPEEMLNYPNEIETLLKQLTAKEVILCGYSFNDQCFQRAFSTSGGAIWCVDPSGPSSNLKGFLRSRKSTNRIVQDEFGTFDRFFEELKEQILETRPAANGAPSYNPFKYLESYEEEDKEWFLGREADTEKFLGLLDGKPRAVHVYGNPRAGKTSFIRAGVLSNLDPNTHGKAYVRCQNPSGATGPEIERQLAADIAIQTGISSDSPDLESVLGSLVVQGKHLVLALDQFERVSNALPDSDEGTAVFLALLDKLTRDDITVAFLAVEEPLYMKRLLKIPRDAPVVTFELRSLDQEKVKEVLHHLMEKAGLEFDERVVQTIVEKYSEATFTLAHVQAVCHMLAGETGVELDSLNAVLNKELGALDKVINEHDILSFVEDFPLPEERTLLRAILKIASARSKSMIADKREQLRVEHPELFAKPSFPGKL